MNKPSPEDLLLGMVDATLDGRATDKPPHRDYKARIHLSAAVQVTEAAAQRGLSVSAYIRRASVAFAAYDLGLDLEEILADEPRWRLRTQGPKTNHDEKGKGHGNWVIKGLK